MERARPFEQTSHFHCRPLSHAYFKGLRSGLCRCGACMDLYRDADVEFLLDENDTLAAHEARGAAQDGGIEVDETIESIVSFRGGATPLR